jgi:hypothetical protein
MRLMKSHGLEQKRSPDTHVLDPEYGHEYPGTFSRCWQEKVLFLRARILDSSPIAKVLPPPFNEHSNGIWKNPAEVLPTEKRHEK